VQTKTAQPLPMRLLFAAPMLIDVAMVLVIAAIVVSK
jgi:hypothetical protein